MKKLSKKGLEIIWSTTTVLIFTVIVLVVIILLLVMFNSKGQEILAQLGSIFG